MFPETHSYKCVLIVPHNLCHKQRTIPQSPHIIEQDKSLPPSITRCQMNMGAKFSGSIQLNLYPDSLRHVHTANRGNSSLFSGFVWLMAGEWSRVWLVVGDKSLLWHFVFLMCHIIVESLQQQTEYTYAPCFEGVLSIGLCGLVYWLIALCFGHG
jgi:hypothetical protein